MTVQKETASGQTTGDLPARFATEGVRFRFGWDDHAAGGPAPFDPEQRRGWMEREQRKRRESCENPFCSDGRCIKDLEAEGRRRDAMWKEVGP